jgi:hypothetical protein
MVNTEGVRELQPRVSLPWVSHVTGDHNNAEGVGEWRGNPFANSFRVKNIIDCP